MRVHNVTSRLASYSGILLITAVTSLTTEWVEADDKKRIVADEKANSISAAMESSLEGLPKLCESVSKSIVRVETKDNLNVTGVIVSSDGHIVVGNGFASVDGPGSIDVRVYLNDGRTVTATPAGWSIEWRLAVLKIHEEGPWPAIELGSTQDLKAGEPCLVMGYSPRGDAKFDSSPTARFGFINRNVSTRWFTTTCFPGFFEVPAVVGMDGRLLGIDTNFVNTQSYVTAVDVLVANRDDLFSGKNVDWVRYPPNQDSVYRIGTGDHAEMVRLRKTDDVLGAEKPPSRMSDSQLSEVKQIARKTTVRLVSKDRLSFDGKAYDRWSGVIVSEDGYILTCAHSSHLPGEKFTIRLSDGRDADAVALGTNPITDIALVKITTPGSWPFAEIAKSSTLKPGDPLVVAGYPAIDKGEWSTERTPQIDATAVRHTLYMMWDDEINTSTSIPSQGGMSGGGVFNRYGGYVATFMGSGHIVSINGHPIPNVATLKQVLETNLAGYCTGDLVPVALRRKGAPMNVLTTLPPATLVNYWMMSEHDTPRRSGFAAIFDTDIELLQPEAGCPVIDVDGRIRGIAIASRGRNETQRGPTSVLPSHIVRRVSLQLMADANSK